MAKNIIPLRPKGTYTQLTDVEQDALTWLVLSGRRKLDVFIEFVRPDLDKSPSAKSYCEQFFAVADTRNYLKDYEETIREFLTPKKKERVVGESREKRAESAIENYKDKVIDALGDDAETDVDTLKDLGQLAKTVGLLKEEEITQKPPIRVLPTRCAECRYKIFIDEQVELGNIEEIYDEV